MLYSVDANRCQLLNGDEGITGKIKKKKQFQCLTSLVSTFPARSTTPRALSSWSTLFSSITTARPRPPRLGPPVHLRVKSGSVRVSPGRSGPEYTGHTYTEREQEPNQATTKYYWKENNTSTGLNSRPFFSFSCQQDNFLSIPREVPCI